MVRAISGAARKSSVRWAKRAMKARISSALLVQMNGFGFASPYHATTVVRAPFDRSGPDRQHRLCAIQRLNLRFLVHTEHHGMRRRMHVQPDDVADFSMSSGSVGSLNVSVRCGCNPNERQMCCTVVQANPLAFAMPRLGRACQVVEKFSASSSGVLM